MKRIKTHPLITSPALRSSFAIALMDVRRYIKSLPKVRRQCFLDGIESGILAVQKETRSRSVRDEFERFKEQTAKNLEILDNVYPYIEAMLLDGKTVSFSMPDGCHPRMKIEL